MRKLSSVQRIVAIFPHENAEKLEIAQIKNWKAVVGKGQFKVGELCMFFEPDAVLPVDERYEFLRKSCYVKKDWVEGFRIKTSTLRGVFSQGLCVPLNSYVQEFTGSKFDKGQDPSEFFVENVCMDDFTRVVKWDPPVPATLTGDIKGAFPQFIPKTDEERIQNLPDVFNDMQRQYEVTVKLDGASFTVYHKDGEVGVCQRNWEQKIDTSNPTTMVKLCQDHGLFDALKKIGRNIALQGELMGPGIQKNRENLHYPSYFVYKIWDIDAQAYMNPRDRLDFLSTTLKDEGVDLKHVPCLYYSTSLEELGIQNLDQLWEFAEGPSLNAATREGLVFKAIDENFSWKIICKSFKED